MQQSRTITRRSASNLALAFCLLPRTTRDDMSALYAFCRQVDDVADDEAVPAEERQAQLSAWREDVHLACNGGQPQFPVNRELKPVIAWYRLRFELFDELLRGVEMDLTIRRYATWEDLELYCYRVASVVGLLSIEIFGYSQAACRDYAVALGKALQLTNILRDVKTDAGRGRIYLPLSELAECGVAPEDILRGEYSPRFQELATRTARHAKGYYRRAREILPPEDRRAMVAAELMGTVYWRLLRKLERCNFRVFDSQPVRLGKASKLGLILRTWYRAATGAESSDYGPA